MVDLLYKQEHLKFCNPELDSESYFLSKLDLFYVLVL